MKSHAQVLSSIPLWTLIVPKLEEDSSLLQLPHDDQVVGVRLPADLDSVSYPIKFYCEFETVVTHNSTWIV